MIESRQKYSGTVMKADLQEEQEALGHQRESGKVSREEHEPLLLQEAGQHLQRHGRTEMRGYGRADAETTGAPDTCSSCRGWKQRRGRWRSKSTTGWSLSSLDGNTMVRGCK